MNAQEIEIFSICAKHYGQKAAQQNKSISYICRDNDLTKLLRDVYQLIKDESQEKIDSILSELVQNWFNGFDSENQHDKSVKDYFLNATNATI